MKASLRSVRIAPKKANLVAKMVRGLSVPEAMDLLHHTNKKAARLIEELLRSAMSNANHNDQQDPQMLVVKTLVVNKAQSYHRGVPMARGRVRPMRKFLSHISLTLGIADEEKEVTKKGKGNEKMEKDASQEGKTPVKKTVRTAGKKTTAKKSSSKPSGSSTVSKKTDTPSTKK